MAFERDFVERYGEDGRSALLTYHRGVKQANLDMIPVVHGLSQAPKPSDQRFEAHFKMLAQKEEYSMKCLIDPVGRGDHEMVTVPAAIAAKIYHAYAEYNAYRCNNIRAQADPKVVDHLDKVTHYLEKMASAADASTEMLPLPIHLINQAYDSVLAEVDPSRYDREVVHPVGV